MGWGGSCVDRCLMRRYVCNMHPPQHTSAISNNLLAYNDEARRASHMALSYIADYYRERERPPPVSARS